jgi:hypothetical protein
MNFEQQTYNQSKVRTGKERIRSKPTFEDTQVLKPGSDVTRKMTLGELKERKNKLEEIRQDIAKEQEGASGIAIEPTVIAEKYGEEKEQAKTEGHAESEAEKKEEKIVGRLIEILGQLSPAGKTKEAQNIASDKSADMMEKIKKILNLYKADKLPRISDREVVFQYLLNGIKPIINAATEKAFNKNRERILLAPSQEARNEAREEVANEISNIEKKYNTDELFEYLNLGLEKGGSFEMG